MIAVEIEREYDLDAAQVWAVLADFGNLSWVPGIQKVDLEGEGIGMIRHLTVPVLPPLHERLDALDHAEMVLEYSIPSVEYIQVENYSARAQVVDLGDGRSRVLMSCKAEAVGPEAEAMARTRAFYGDMLGWIDDFLKKQPKAGPAGAGVEGDRAMKDDAETTSSGASARRFEIEGRTLEFPSLFQDASSAMGLFPVPSSAAQALIRDSGFEVAELWPGRAAFSLSCVHYRESDCGVYNEVAMAFFVKPKHGRPSRIPYLGTWLDITRGNAATHVWRLPVTSKLALDAGVLMWGLPKTIEEIDFEVADGRGTFRLRMDGREVLGYSVPAAGTRSQPHGVSAFYSIYEGAPQVTYLEHQHREVGVSFRGGRLHLGDHPLADQLRGLGLPRRPLVATWVGRLSLEVGAPQKL